MLDQILDSLDPYITEALVVVFGAVLTRIFHKDMSERRAQENLSKALDTGVDLVTDALAFAVADAPAEREKIVQASVKTITDYVEGSVPDSLKILKAKRRHLEKMAKAKANSLVQKKIEQAQGM